MIHNSFRRIALAQGLLPARAYLSDLPDTNKAPGATPASGNRPAHASELSPGHSLGHSLEYSGEHPTEHASQV